MKSNARRRALTNAALVLASTLLAILAGEAVTRFMGIKPHYGQPSSTGSVPLRTVNGIVLWNEKEPRCNSEDIRRAASDRDAFKIIGLGDSIMYGLGQPKEGTYLEHTRRALAGRSNRRVEILNLATGGFNTRQENAVYEELGDQIKPDLVLVHYWADDVRQYREVGGYVVHVGDVSDDGRLVVRAFPLPARLSDFLLFHSRLYDLLTQVMVAHDIRTERPDWSVVSKPLAEIEARAKRAGARLVVLASPALDGAVAKPTSDLPALRQFAAPRGIEVIDLADWLHGIDPKQVTMDGCHFNAEGHRRMAERLTEYLLQHDLKEWSRP